MFDQIKYVRYIVHKASSLNVQCIQGDDTESDRDFVNMNEVQKSSCVLDFFPLSSFLPSLYRIRFLLLCYRKREMRFQT